MSEIDLLKLINSIILSPLALLYIYLLNDEWRLPAKRAGWLFCGLACLLLALEALVFRVLGYGFVSKVLVSVLMVLVALPSVLLIARPRYGQMLFIFTSVSNICFFSATMGELIGCTSNLERLAVKLTVQAVILYLVARFLRKPFHRLLRGLQDGWFRLTLIPASFSLLFFILVEPGLVYHNSYVRLIAVALCIAMFCVYGVLYDVFLRLQEQFRVREDNTLLRAQMVYLNRMVTSAQTASEQMRIFRHDMRHYLQLQAASLDSGDVAAAQRVIDSMGRRLDGIWDSSRLSEYTRRPLIDAVLSFYAQRAKEAGIRLEIRLDLPDPLPAEQTGLAVVISNALENAVNACRAQPPGQPREIRVNGYRRYAQYFMEIRNTYSGQVRFNQDGSMPVSEKAGHGYGTQSIATFAEKNHALAQYQAEDGWFSLRVLFNAAAGAGRPLP